MGKNCVAGFSFGVPYYYCFYFSRSIFYNQYVCVCVRTFKYIISVCVTCQPTFTSVSQFRHNAKLSVIEIISLPLLPMTFCCVVFFFVFFLLCYFSFSLASVSPFQAPPYVTISLANVILSYLFIQSSRYSRYNCKSHRIEMMKKIRKKVKKYKRKRNLTRQMNKEFNKFLFQVLHFIKVKRSNGT